MLGMAKAQRCPLILHAIQQGLEAEVAGRKDCIFPTLTLIVFVRDTLVQKAFVVGSNQALDPSLIIQY